MSCQWGLGEVLTQRPGKLGECSCSGSSLLLLAHWLILLFPCTLAFPDSLPGERLTLPLNLTCSYTSSSLKKEVYWFLPSLSQFQTYRKRDPGWPSFGLDDCPWPNQLWLGARAHDMTQDGCLWRRLLECSLSWKMLRKVPHESEVRKRSQSQWRRVEHH